MKTTADSIKRCNDLKHQCQELLFDIHLLQCGGRRDWLMTLASPKMSGRLVSLHNSLKMFSHKEGGLLWHERDLLNEVNDAVRHTLEGVADAETASRLVACLNCGIASLDLRLNQIETMEVA